ncbi:MAG: phosphoribosyltransferase domain-containing protein [Salibacteraceae bacterium]
MNGYMKTIVLNSARIEKILRRIALQVVEECHDEPEVVIIGIEPRGSWVSERIAKILETENLNFSTHSIKVSDESGIALLKDTITGKPVILVDDILNSGYTMMKALSMIMTHNPKRILTACLVDRLHRKYPVQCDLTGLSLATTLQEHLKLDVMVPEIVLE